MEFKPEDHSRPDHPHGLVDAHQTRDAAHVANVSANQLAYLLLGETALVPQKWSEAFREPRHHVEVSTAQSLLARGRVPFSDGYEMILDTTTSERPSVSQPMGDVPCDLVKPNAFQESVDNPEKSGSAGGIGGRVARVTGCKGNVPADFTGEEYAARSQNTSGFV